MTMFDSSQPTLFEETELPSMSSAVASRARTSHSLADALASKVSALVSGENTGDLLANDDPASSSWRTCQACLVSGWEPFSETWPRSGMMLSGTACQLAPSAPLTGEIVSGLLPTPTTSEGTGAWHSKRKQGGANLRTVVQMLPTPTAKANMLAPSMQKWPAHRNLVPTPRASDGERGGRGELLHYVKTGTPRGPLLATPTSRDWRSGKASAATMAKNSRPLSEQIGGSLNPTWVEWLMGFPTEYTALEPSATPSSRKSPNSSDEQS